MTGTPATTGGFDFNRPTIIALLYLGAFLVAITTFVGVIFAYLWRQEPHEDWEDSHLRWHVRTFWMGLGLCVLAAVGTLLTLGIGAFIFFPLVAIWFAVRTIKALLAAQKRAPIPNVETWLF